MSDYPFGLDVRPLTTWPGPLTAPHNRKRSQFSAPVRNTLTVLNRELWHIGATTSVMEVAIPAGQFRIDGRPRATARADHPGVDFLHGGQILSVVGKRGPRCCSECHAIGLVRDYGHDGDHGESAPYTVWPTDEEIEAVTASAVTG